MKHKMDYVQKCVSWFSRLGGLRYVGGLFHKPLCGDPVIKQPGFSGMSAKGVFFVAQLTNRQLENLHFFLVSIPKRGGCSSLVVDIGV